MFFSFFLLKCFFIPPFFLSLIQTLQIVCKVSSFFLHKVSNKQPVLSSSHFSDVPHCEAALGQQETLVTCISDLESATVCMRFEDSSKLVGECHICIDL